MPMGQGDMTNITARGKEKGGKADGREGKTELLLYLCRQKNE